MLQEKKSTSNKTPLLKLLSLLLVSIALSLLIVIVHFTLASATITVTAAKIPIHIESEITIPLSQPSKPEEETISPIEELRTAVLGTNLSKQDLATQEALYAEVISLPLSIDHTVIPQEGSKKIPTKATGTVTIFNELPFSQPLVANTRLLAQNGILFRLKDRVVVPGESSIAAGVEANETGEKGNILPTTFTIPGLSPQRQKAVYAKSDSPFIGGIKTVTMLTEADFTRAKQEAINLLKEKALETFNTERAVTENQLIFSDVKMTSPDAVGEEKEKLIVTASLNAHAVVIDSSALLAQTKAQLAAEVLPPFRVLLYNDDSFTYEISALDMTINEVLVKSYLEGFKAFQPSSPPQPDQTADAVIDKQTLIGRSAEEIQAQLLKNEAIQEVRVQFSPFWVTRAPRIPKKITIIVQ